MAEFEGENRDYQIQFVLDSLRTMDAATVKARLDIEFKEKQAADPKVGIVIAPFSEMPKVAGDYGQEYAFYAARVYPPRPGEQNFVTPHLHKKGSEPYRFLNGKDGEMNIGTVEGEKVKWGEPKTVQQGDEVVIQQDQVHSFRNNGKEPYDFVFACPDSHLKDFDSSTMPDGDRHIVKNLEGGIPSWYK